MTYPEEDPKKQERTGWNFICEGVGWILFCVGICIILATCHYAGII